MVARRQGRMVLPLRSAFSSPVKSGQLSAGMTERQHRRACARGPPLLVRRRASRAQSPETTLGGHARPPRSKTKNQPSS